MSADVSRLIKSTAGGEGQRGPITRDFLGASFGIESKELDLDLHVPVGWEKRLDLKSGNVYIQRCSSNPIVPTTTCSTIGLRNNIQTNSSSLVLHHDFSFPSSQTQRQTQTQSKPKRPPTSSALSLFDDPTNLDLKLVSPATTAAAAPSTTSSYCYQSICTLDKVKSALDRAWRDPPHPSTASSSSLSGKKRPSPTPTPTPTAALSCSSDCTSNVIDQQGNRGNGNSNSNSNSDSNGNGCLMVAAACPCCLLYVLISKDNPKCPKCNSFIPSSVNTSIPKKPKIDLNISI